MNGAGTGDADLRAMLARLNERLASRDPAISQDFAADAVLAGSDLGDLSRGRTAIGTHFTALFALPFVIRFDWTRIDTFARDDFGWLFAEGHGVLVRTSGEERFDYHLSGVFSRMSGDWEWTLFHGSAPKP
jgi:hypothetical protein